MEEVDESQSKEAEELQEQEGVRSGDFVSGPNVCAGPVPGVIWVGPGPVPGGSGSFPDSGVGVYSAGAGGGETRDPSKCS